MKLQAISLVMNEIVCNNSQLAKNYGEVAVGGRMEGV